MSTPVSLSLTLRAQDTGERPPTDPNDGRSFTSVISDLHKSYPKDRMEEISTSFCFICLLHLANERGLKLDSGSEDTIILDEEEDKKVGNIWDLKVRLSARLVHATIADLRVQVYRDPDATPAA